MPKRLIGSGWKLDRIELSRELGVSIRTVDRWIHERLVPYYKWGGMVRFDLDDVKDALERRKIKEVV